ncbi:DUF2169 domain-containing protein [Paracoccaceae bacterium GXU_MW_L88]
MSLDLKAPSAPQGYGPIPPWWQARSQYAGTYDESWEVSRSPRLPEDFDYRFYQVVHPNLILKNYLKPQQNIRMVGLVPGCQYLDVSLPDIAPWAKFSFNDGREVNVCLNCDGLHLDMREDVWWLDLTWRCWMEICPAFYRVDLYERQTAPEQDMVWSAQDHLTTEAP